MTQATVVRHRSYSQLNQYRNCGEQFRLERIEHTPSRPSCPAVAGSIFHTVSEHIDHAMHGGETNADTLRQLGSEIAAREVTVALTDEATVFPVDEWKRYGRAVAGKPNGEDMNWFAEVGIPNCTDAYIAWRLSKPELTIAVIPGFGPAIEVPFDYYVDSQKVHGFIDRIFQEDDKLFPVDLKTGQKPKTDEQLGLYAAALRAGLGWDVRWGFYLYGLKTGVAKITPPLDVSHWVDSKLAEMYVPLNVGIDAGIFIPHPGEACFSCGVNHACAFAQAAI